MDILTKTYVTHICGGVTFGLEIYYMKM